MHKETAVERLSKVAAAKAVSVEITEESTGEESVIGEWATDGWGGEFEWWTRSIINIIPMYSVVPR